MLRLGWLLPLLLIACARTPEWPPAGACEPASAPASARLLSVSDDRERQWSLILHTETDESGTRTVALNAVGVPQFTATRTGEGLEVVPELGYRGPEAQWLLWGLSWWQRREQLSEACEPGPGYRLAERGAEWLILAGEQVLWRWDSASPRGFQLPARGLSVEVKESQKER